MQWPMMKTAMDAGFRCARCRIWTGAASASIADAAAADEDEFYTISSHVEIVFEPNRRGLRVVRSIGTRKRSLFIAEEAIRTIDTYSPSPFSMAIIVQIDVSDTTQQCLFLGQLSTSSASTQEEPLLSSTALRISDRSQVLDCLNVVHRHLRNVPLTAGARELLAKKTTQEATTIGPGATARQKMLKRRRTVTPADFYGRTTHIPSPNKGNPDATAEDAASWASFYERLQFNVSHSLLCQLEGTAPLSASFPRQQEAFEFADQVAAFRERLAVQRHQTQHDRHADPPRVFCFEGANEGKRRFWVTTMSAFWREYSAIPKGSRHVYEIIREGVPCRLYFDLESKKQLNPRLDGDALVSRLISLLQLQIYRQYHLVIKPEQHVVQLESSTTDKFSRHLTIHLPNGELFADNIHVGAFVRQFIHDLVASDQDDVSQFLVRDSADDNDQRQFFIDVGVYTRNRMFRVLGSSKFRKTAVLRALVDNPTDDSSDSLDYDLFLRSIVCPLHSIRVGASTRRLLRCEDPVSLKRYGIGGLSRGGGFHAPMRSVESKASIYPALDAFIRSIAVTGGVQGEIRAVKLLYPTADSQEQATETLLSEPVRIVYHMMKNRWCENVSRPHRSNNVTFVVDLLLQQYYQRCHDPQCQAMDYRSPSRPLPREVVLESKINTTR